MGWGGEKVWVGSGWNSFLGCGDSGFVEDVIELGQMERGRKGVRIIQRKEEGKSG